MAETPAPDANHPFDPARPASSSRLFYLFSDRALPQTRRGTPAPLSDGHVDTSLLANVLFTSAFWRLGEAALVRLEAVEERKLFKSTTRLRITRVSGAGAELCDGIENGILDTITPGTHGKLTPAWESQPQWIRDRMAQSEGMRAAFANLPNFPNLPAAAHGPSAPPPGTVTDVVVKWYGNHVRDPESVPITWTEREGIAKGYLTAEDAGRNPIVAAFAGATTIMPQRERIVALEPVFAQQFGRWQAFNANEAALARLLAQEVGAGINARRDTSDTGSFT